MNNLLVIGGTAIFGSLLLKAFGGSREKWDGVIDLVNELPIHTSKRYATRSKEQIKNLVIHHSAAVNQSPFVIARFHVEGTHLSATGAPGIAYHFYILEDGTTYQTNYLQTVSWHIRNNNTASVGICLSGNFEQADPTSKQLQSLERLLKALKRALPNTRVIGHRELVATSCPGSRFDITRFKRL